MDIGYIFVGFVVGFLVGLTGVGGGSLMTPILVLFYNIKPALALGTDLLYASITKSVGIYAHLKLGNINWQIVKRLAIGSIPASIAMTLVLKNTELDSAEAINSIKFWLGVALIATSLAVLLRNKLAEWVKHEHFLPQSWVMPTTVLMGGVLGLLVTLTSVGAGALGVTALLMIYPKEKITTIVGSDIAHAVPLTMVAGLGHAAIGTVDYSLLGTLLIGSLPGIYLGSHLSTNIADYWIRTALALILIFVGIKLILH